MTQITDWTDYTDVLEYPPVQWQENIYSRHKAGTYASSDIGEQTMSKDCKECDYCGRMEYDTGYIPCEYDGPCPYNEESEPKVEGMTVTFDIENIETIMRHTVSNSLRNYVREIAYDLVKKKVNDLWKHQLQDATETALEKYVEKCLAEFMSGKISISHGWDDSEELTRETYFGQIIEKKLDKATSKNSIDDLLDNQVKKAMAEMQKNIEDNVSNFKKDTVTKLNNIFDSAMRANLTDAVVGMLMSNETYQKLSNSIKLLGKNKED